MLTIWGVFTCRKTWPRPTSMPEDECKFRRALTDSQAKAQSSRTPCIPCIPLTLSCFQFQSSKPLMVPQNRVIHSLHKPRNVWVYMHICIYIYMYMHMCNCICIYIHMKVHIHICTCTYIYIYRCLCLCVSTSTYIYIYTKVYVFISVEVQGAKNEYLAQTIFIIFHI